MALTVRYLDNSQEEDEGDGTSFPSDTAEYAARKIFEAIENEKSEIYAHDWMNENKD